MSAPIASIQSVLYQMNQVASMAAPRPLSMQRTDDVTGTAAPGFAAEFKLAVERVSAAQNHATTQARHFELGTPGVTLNDVMIDMQKASLGFQSLVQVRNKLVSAYQTIASMPL
ncbi:flagellar hook-basal body complex protein FliE [Bordetella sp. 15P40C-2]|uniref:flagellar hook-basal body complex protein FliE n=1 Tax=Bordetella sp. 15P40C-2 TaxID=2572246 RepID=UPI00132C28FB|nr:flagellar hook-basal body complex protein FliE [Bordetella sp. 15P40C-2]MVW69952.1 flagellar hook-basal body complex protein FliE [Bordetella sp. 15P40C-2]